VLTMRGEPVWEESRTVAAGREARFIWDGRNKSGQEAASGVYAVRVTGGGINGVKRAVVLGRTHKWEVR